MSTSLKKMNLFCVSFLLLLLCVCSVSSSSLPSMFGVDRARLRESLVRSLAIGDFQELNDLIRTAEVGLPDTQQTSFLLDVYLTNIRCTKFQIGDIVLGYDASDLRSLTVQLDIKQLDAECYTNYEYSTLFFYGQGSATVESTNNEALTQTTFRSPNFKYFPPESSSLRSCQPRVNLDDVVFEGGLSFIPEGVEGILRGLVENQAERVLCEVLESLTTDRLVDLLQDAKTILSNFTNSIHADPLGPERALEGTNSMKFLNLREKETATGRWFKFALEELVNYLSAYVDDPDGVRYDQQDMRINVLLRSFLEDRAYVLDISELPIGGLLYQGHDQLTETTITVDSVKLLGLDTFTMFKPLYEVGNLTLQTELAWEYLIFEFTLTIDIKPSTKDNSIIANPGTTNVVETVTVKFGLEDLDGVASMLLAVDQDALESLELGELISSSRSTLACLLSRVHDVKLSSFSVTVGDVRPPSLDGFVSRGIDRVVTSAVEATFAAYEGVLLQAAPGFFQTTVKEILNKEVSKLIAKSGAAEDCIGLDIPDEDINNGFVDLRDLLLSPDEARTAGGMGSEPYGSIVPKVLPMVEERFVSTDEDGLPKLNGVIRPATEAQSGLAGTLSFPAAFVNYTNSDIWVPLIERFFITMSHFEIDNLDTVIEPLLLFRPTDSSVLSNQMSFGPASGRSLDSRFRLGFGLEGNNSPLSMRNEVEIGISVPSTAVMLNFVLQLKEKELLKFPVKDLSNINCWLATIPNPEQNVFGELVGENPGLTLDGITTTLVGMVLNMRCLSCTSPGGQALPEIMDALVETGIMSKLEHRIDDIVEDLIGGYWRELDVPALVSKAPQFCPHSPYFVGSEAGVEMGWPGFPKLSQDSIESLLLVGAVIAECSLLLVAKSHLLLPMKTSDPLSGQNALVVPTNMRLLDWTNLGGSVGSWADGVLEEARSFLGSSKDGTEGQLNTTDLVANGLLQEYVLDDEGGYDIDMNELTFRAGDLIATLSSLRIQGLDSLTLVDVLNPISPQTLLHQAKFANLTLSAEVMVDTNRGLEVLDVSFQMENVDVEAATLLAIHLDDLGDIRMGSVLKSDHLLPCLFSKFYDFQIPQLLVTSLNIGEPAIRGFIDPEFLHDFSRSLGNLFTMFREDLITALPKVFDITIRDVLNRMLEIYRKGEREVCGFAPGNSKSTFLDFRDLLLPATRAKEYGASGSLPYGDAFEIIFSLLSDEVELDENGAVSSINDLIVTPVTEGQSNSSGVVDFQGEILNVNGTLKVSTLKAAMKFVIANASVENLDTVGQPLRLLQPLPDEPYSLRNLMGVGVGGRPLKVSARVLVELSDDADFQLKNEVDVSIQVDALQLFVDILLKISEDRFFNIPIRDVPDFKCWLSTIPMPSNLTSREDEDESKSESESESDRSISLTEYSASAKEITVNVSCVSCSSPDFDTFLSELYTPGDSEEEIKKFFTKTRDYVDKVLGSDFLENFLDKAITDATKQCPHHPAYDPEASFSDLVDGDFDDLFGFEKASRDKRMAGFNIANGIVAACLIFFVLGAKWYLGISNKKWRAALSDDDKKILLDLEERTAKEQTAIDNTTPSLFRSPHIPFYIRWGVPLVVVLNIGLFLGAHLGLLSYIDLEGQFAGEPYRIHRFVEFRFFNAAANTYRNGGNEMGIFLIVFSGIWPYLKLVTSLVLWFVPPSKVSTSTRGSIFLWLDVLTKLSVIDVFMMLIAVAAVLVYIGGRDNGLIDPSDYYSLKLLIVPSGGFYSIIMAQRISRVSSKFFLDYHDKVASITRREYERGMLPRKGSTTELTIETAEMSGYSFKSESLAPRNNSSNNSSLALFIFGEERAMEDDILVDETGRVCEKGDVEVPSIFAPGSSRPLHRIRKVNSDELSTLQDSYKGTSEPRSLQSDWSERTTVEVRLGRRFVCMRGSVAVALAGFAIVVLLVIGFILAPSASLEIRRALGIAVDSGNTFAQAVEDYNVFRVVCLLLVETRVVLETTEDYVGLGILLTLVILAALGFSILQVYNSIVRVMAFLKQRRYKDLEETEETCTINRLKAWQHMEVYVIALIFASWQLGAIAAYVIHYYCDLMKILFDLLSYVGLVQSTSASCFKVQVSDSTTLGILLGAFTLLFVSFLSQAITQYKKNKASSDARLTDAGWVIGKK